MVEKRPPAFSGSRLRLTPSWIAQSTSWLGRLAKLDLLYRHDQLFVRRNMQAEGLTTLDDDAVEVVDLGAPAFLHVLAHRRPLRLAAILRVAHSEQQRFDSSAQEQNPQEQIAAAKVGLQDARDLGVLYERRAKLNQLLARCVRVVLHDDVTTIRITEHHELNPVEVHIRLMAWSGFESRIMTRPC